ncbi:MAG: bifunctional oligoribonuclease/PAP phosphatase NrnA [Cyanobacteria bacterium J06642_2]
MSLEAEMRATVPLSPNALEELARNSNGSNGGTKAPALRERMPAQLCNILERHRGDRHLIVLQDFPDPDALSSAWAYSLICEAFEIETEAVYAGTLSHQENIALVRLTHLPCQKWNLGTKQPNDLLAYQGAVFLDNQGTTSQITALVEKAELPVVAIVDHHSLQNRLEAEFQDIRVDASATATIFAQYLQSGPISLDNNNSTHVNCATALMHGLRSETSQLMHAKEEDFQAAAFLSRICDDALLGAILQSARSRRVMDIIERALKDRIIRNNFSVAGVGYLRYEDRDAIPQAADFLMTEEDVHTAVVYGIARSQEDGREMVTGSLRTNKLTLDPDEFLKKAFGQDGEGRFFGGGRSRAGGFEIDLGFLSGFNENADYAERKWHLFDRQIRQKLERIINPDD